MKKKKKVYEIFCFEKKGVLIELEVDYANQTYTINNSLETPFYFTASNALNEDITLIKLTLKALLKVKKDFKNYKPLDIESPGQQTG